MSHRVHYHPDLIFSPGTQVVTLVEVVADTGKVQHPRGAVGVIVKSPVDRHHSYRIKFPDGVETSLLPDEITLLAKVLEGEIDDNGISASQADLFERVAYRCIIGSQAYGLSNENSDVDRRGFYLPPASLHWSLYGVPDLLERHETQEAYWEIQRFFVLALKANPNVLESLFTPLVEHASPFAQQLLDERSIFLSRLVYQTYNGYVMSQFKKMQADLRNRGEVKPKHVMHLIRLLLAGIQVLRTGTVPLDVGEYRDRLLAIRNGESAWEEVDEWRKSLHGEFDTALAKTNLPERPDYKRANALLVEARRLAAQEGF